MMKNTIHWFEIPVEDIYRATRFYAALLDAEMTVQEINPGYPMAVLPNRDGVSGALVQGDGYTPGPVGILIYLVCDGDLDSTLRRAASAGGRILMPKTNLGSEGYAAIIQDTENNRVGLYAGRIGSNQG